MIKETFVFRLAMMIRAFEVPSLDREEGQTLAEYALILALIAVVVTVAVIALGGNITSIFNSISSDL